MSAARKGKKQPGISKALTGKPRPSTRKPHSAEWNARIAASLTGKTSSAEAKAKQSAARKKFWAERTPGEAYHSDATRAVMAERARNRFSGKPWSAARRAAHEARKVLAEEQPVHV